MGFFKKLFNGNETQGSKTRAAPLTVCAPLTGTVIPIENIPDPLFSQGILGPGCGIEPEGETVYAPFDGKVIQVPETKHAIGLQSNDGLELLIHVGMDTVAMAGQGFVCHVAEGQKIKAGQELFSFSLADIKSAGHTATTAIILTNSDDYSGIAMNANGRIQQGEALFKAGK